MFSYAISGTTFCGVLLSRDQHHWYQFRLDMSHPCSGSTVEVSPFSVIDQKLHATMSHLTQNIWEIQDRLVLAKREYERTIFQNNEDLIAQYETADDLTESYNIGENCEVKESLSHLIGLLTEISLQMKPLQTGYATHRFLSVSWTDTVIRNALCELNMLSIYVQGNTTRTHCSFIVKFRHLGIGERRTFALWMLGRINSALNLVPGLVSEYSRVRNQMFAWL
eukprot:XP_019929769.1 PREDICTED: uncharacterized protein LOC105345570 [Crassostrea gigas]